MKPYLKTIIILNTIGIIIFSLTFIIGKVGIYNNVYDLRIGGVIFLASIWGYIFGLFRKKEYSQKKKGKSD